MSGGTAGESQRTCPKCGKEIPAGAKRCRNRECRPRYVLPFDGPSRKMLRKPRDLPDRVPGHRQTCVYSHETDWKRDALLFDLIYVPSRVVFEIDIPLELTFGIASADASVNARVQDAGVPSDPVFDMETTVRRPETLKSYGRMGYIVTPSYGSYKSFVMDFTAGQERAYEGALNNLPVIAAGQVPWDQILDFRKDAEAAGKYRDLRLWLERGVNAQSVQEATDVIGKKIQDYEWAIKKHGLKTVSGGISAFFDWKQPAITAGAATVAGNVGGPVWSALVAGIFLSGQIAARLVEHRVKLIDVKRGEHHEVAVLHDARRKFGK